MVDKKHLKIGVAAFAIAALVIGLSVGLTQKSNKSTNNLSSSQAYGTYDIDAAYDCSYVSAPPSSKAEKAGKARRALNVPGTEDAASAGIRFMLRDQLVERELPSKSSKKGGKKKGGKKKGGKKKGGKKKACYCKDGKGKSGKSGDMSSSSKSGKSGDMSSSSKSGKSGGGSDLTSSAGKSGKSGGSDVTSSAGKSGKSSPTAPSVMEICSEGIPPDVEDQTGTFSTQPGTFSTSASFSFENDPSPSPTEGGTTTVATEKDSLFFQEDRGTVRP